MQALFDSKFPILLQGETGTGKSTYARTIHDSSIHKSEPFIKCNLASLNDNLFSSELFGHVRGAFTGACSDKLGFCDYVESGTLFLDEIGELSLNQQKKLLNILDENSYESVGSTKVKSFRGRFIFATHRNLESMVRDGRFREDLYFRLACESIKLKSFFKYDEMKRREIFNKNIVELRERYRFKNLEISKEVMGYFLSYFWPGNLREVVNTLEYIALKSGDRALIREDLPEKFKQNIESKGMLADQIGLLERKIIENEVVNRGMGVNKASKSLGISKTTLIAKMRKYGITVHHFKEVNRSVA